MQANENELKNVRSYGGAGALLMLIGSFIPYAGIALFLVGLVLVILAVKEFSEISGDEEIFKNYVISLALMLAAILALFFIAGASMLSMIATRKAAHGIAGFVSSMLVFWIIIIASAYFLNKSYSSISEKSGVNLFRITGLGYLIGAASSIIIIGFLILFIARILEVISFFSLPEKMPAKKI